MDSILDTVKVSLGIQPGYTHFDDAIIMHINSIFPILYQLGVGSDSGFSISDASSTWSDFIGTDPRLNMVQSYMSKKVGLLFDPPLNSSLLESQKNLISELEWRLNVQVDPGPTVS